MKSKKFLSKAIAYLIAFTMVAALIPAIPASAVETDLEISIQGDGGEFTVTMNDETWSTTGCGKEDGVEGSTMRAAGYTSVSTPVHPDGKVFEGWCGYKKDLDAWAWVKITDADSLTADEMLDYPIPAMGLMFRAKWQGEDLDGLFPLPTGNDGGIDGNGGSFTVITTSEEYETSGCGDGGIEEGMTFRDMNYVDVINPVHPEGYAFLGWYPCKNVDGDWVKIEDEKLMTSAEMLDWPFPDFSVIFFAQWEGNQSGSTGDEEVTYEEPVLTLKCNDGTVEGKWTAAGPAEEVGYYRVYRAKYSSSGKVGDYKRADIWVSDEECRFEDYDTEEATKYAYKVLAYDNEGNRVATSAAKSIAVPLYTPACEMIVHDAATGCPMISIYIPEKANKCYVYRSTSKTKGYEYIGATSKSSYIDKKAVSGKTYYYKLKAVADNREFDSDLSGYKAAKKVKADSKLARAIKATVNSKGEIVHVTTLDEAVKAASKGGVTGLAGFAGSHSSIDISAIKKAGGSLSFPGMGFGDPYFSNEVAIVKKNKISYNSANVVSYGVNVLKVAKGSTKSEITSLINSTANKYFSASSWKVSSSKYSPSTTKYSAAVKEMKGLHNTYVKKAGYSKYATNIYYLKITNKKNSKKNGWTFVTVVPTLTKLSKPTIKVANISGADMKVSWKKVSGANKYEVWKKVGSKGTYKKVKTTTSTSFKDKSTVKGKKYYYKVKAIKTSNSTQNSYYSTTKSLTCK